MNFIILYRLTHDIDVLKYISINLAGLLTSNLLESVQLITSIIVTVTTCIAGLVLVYYKVRAIKKELKEAP